MGKPVPADSKVINSDVVFNTSSKTKLAESAEGGGGGDYDPFDHRDLHGLGTTGALFHMVKGSLGTGILAMPMAFKNAGLWVGLFGAFFIGFLCTHCVSLLVECSHVLSKRTMKPSLGFAETSEAAFRTGPVGLRKYSSLVRETVNISLMITYYLGDTVYIVFIATTFKQLADRHLELDLNIRLYVLMLTVVLVPIGCIRQLKYLVPFSSIAIVFLMFGCGFVLYDVFTDIPPLDSRPFFSSWKRLPMYYATMCFSIEGIGTVLPIENAMKTPRHFLGWPGVLNTAMAWLVFTYTSVGFFGYLRYGEATQGNITLNLGFTFFGEMVKILVALNVVCSYPLLLCVVSESVWKYLDPRVSEAHKTQHYYTMRVCLILGTILLAVALPDLEPFIGLVGTVCFSTLGLCFPAVLELVTFHDDPQHMGVFRWRIAKNYVLLIAWVVCIVAGLQASIAQIVEIYWP